jgi:hypothetical protein
MSIHLVRSRAASDEEYPPAIPDHHPNGCQKASGLEASVIENGFEAERTGASTAMVKLKVPDGVSHVYLKDGAVGCDSARSDDDRRRGKCKTPSGSRPSESSALTSCSWLARHRHAEDRPPVGIDPQSRVIGVRITPLRSKAPISRPASRRSLACSGSSRSKALSARAFSRSTSA